VERLFIICKKEPEEMAPWLASSERRIQELD